MPRHGGWPTPHRTPTVRMPPSLSAEAARAHDQLAHAVADLADQNRSTPCQGEDGALWLSETTDDRLEAARRCAPCPLLDICDTTARVARERWGVWGGRDRTPRPVKAKTAESVSVDTADVST